MRTRTATCACGRLRATCQGEPVRVWICCRTACQKRTGSVHSAHAYFGRAHVRTEGTAKRFRRSSDAGRWVETAFCPERGSTVYWEVELLPDRMGVAAGAFADPDFPAPHAAVWAENEYRCFPLPAGIPARQEQT